MISAGCDALCGAGKGQVQGGCVDALLWDTLPETRKMPGQLQGGGATVWRAGGVRLSGREAAEASGWRERRPCVCCTPSFGAKLLRVAREQDGKRIRV